MPIVLVRHEHFVTVATDDIEPSLPVVRAPDATLYSRADVNSLLVGGWEPMAMSIDPRDLKLEDDAPRIDEDWPVLHAFAEQFGPLYPAALDLGIRTVFKGWPTFVPDGRFVIGESCRVKGFVMAGGCNAHGVSGSAGIGRHVVEAMLEAKPLAYVQSLSPDRFTERSWEWATARRATNLRALLRRPPGRGSCMTVLAHADGGRVGHREHGRRARRTGDGRLHRA